jgi:hypothetical protein
VADVALYLQQSPTSRWVELFLRYGDQKPRSIARFSTTQNAEEFQVWLEAAITAVGRANALLAANLEQ